MRTFPLVVTMQDPEFKHPTSYQYNFTIQRELPFQTTIDIAYVGRIGLYLQRERNINQLLPGTRQANPGVNTDALRPFNVRIRDLPLTPERLRALIRSGAAR